MARGWLLAAVALVACGSRTPLLLPGEGAAGGAGSGNGTTLAVPCAAALLDGAPTPMRGWCPTRANQATGRGPRAPKVAWTATPFAIPDPENYLPAQIVVDAGGRAYVAVDASPMNMAGGPNRVSAIDPDGTVAWTTTLPAAVSDLALGRDGTLWLVEASGMFGTMVGLGSDGSIRASLDLGGPSDAGLFYTFGAYDSFGIGSDGSFFVGSSQNGALARVAADGTLLWQTPSEGPDQFQVIPPVILTPDDDVVGSGGQGVMEVSPSGQVLWQEAAYLLPLTISGVDARGLFVSIGSEGGTSGLSLVTVNGQGVTVSSFPLGLSQDSIDATQLALAGDGTAVVLLADEVSSPGADKTHVTVVAVEPSGKTRWTAALDASLPFDPAALQTHYGVFVDGGGTVVVTAGAVTGLDLSSGSVLWTLQPANPKQCLRPAVLGAGGSILASQCDGTVLLARDP